MAVSVGGTYRWSTAVYVELRGALRGSRARRSRGVPQLTFPCRVDTLVLPVDIDTAVATWEPHGKGTIDRLHQLAGRPWRPQDCELLNTYRGQLQRWVLDATELLDAAPRLHLEVPCPVCRASFAYHRNIDGESIRPRALRVSEDGCRCGACGAFWEPDRFHWLARLLGCPALPA